LKQRGDIFSVVLLLYCLIVLIYSALQGWAIGRQAAAAADGSKRPASCAIAPSTKRSKEEVTDAYDPLVIKHVGEVATFVVNRTSEPQEDGAVFLVRRVGGSGGWRGGVAPESCSAMSMGGIL
jgi:hypothetical protein